jgi:hypothetical protein
MTEMDGDNGTNVDNNKNVNNNQNNSDANDNEKGGVDQELAAYYRPAFDADDAGFMSAVWGSAPDDVFIVGGQPEQGVVYHFDGAVWAPIDVGEIPILVWVYGFGPDDVFAVGEEGIIIHYDGQSWTKMESGTTEDLWGVWGATNDDIWVVGTGSTIGEPVLLHYDGTTWSRQELPERDRLADSLFKVWGTSADHVFAVGSIGLILQYDGNTWQQIPSGTGNDLISLWGTRPDNIVAVGGRTNGVIATWDGSKWISRSVAPIPGLNGIFMENSNEVTFAGLLGTAGSFIAGSSNQPFEEDTQVAQTLHAVWGDGQGLTYVVGGNTTETPYRGIVLIREVVPVGSY